MIIYLDFDGVLHPSDVYLVDDQPILKLSDDRSLELFCWAPILESILDDHDPVGQIKIVLSTTWSHQWGWEKAADGLPEGLRNRVVGATSPILASRGKQIKFHAEYFGITDWIAIDDDAWDWPDEHRHQLILANPDVGLSSIKTQRELRANLEGYLK